MSYEGVSGYGTTRSGGTAPAALQSNITGTAVAMYALDNSVGLSNVLGSDRSGNGNDMVNVNANWTCPDIIPGNRAWQPWPDDAATYVCTAPAGINQAAAGAAMLRLTGEMSITLRVAKGLYPGGNTAAWNKFEYMVSFGNGDDATAAGNTLYSLVLNAGGTSGTLVYYAENGVHAGIVFDSGIKLNSLGGALNTDGLWHFISMTRTAAGVVTLGVDGNFATSGALGVPTGGTTSRVNVGRPPYTLVLGSPDCGLVGQIKDVCIWPRILTANEQLTLRRQAMGPYFIS